jgi:hypothetical protein
MVSDNAATFLPHPYRFNAWLVIDRLNHQQLIRCGCFISYDTWSIYYYEICLHFFRYFDLDGVRICASDVRCRDHT